MANPLAGKYSVAFNPAETSFVPPNVAYGKQVPNYFGGLTNQPAQQPVSTGSAFEDLLSRLPKEKQEELLMDEARGRLQMAQTKETLSGLMPKDYSLEELGEFRKREMELAQKLGKESVGEAAKYSMLTSIPKTIAQAYGNIAAQNLYAGQAISDTFSKTLEAYPNFQVVPYQFQPQRYFG
jgi:hypothetical protein